MSPIILLYPPSLSLALIHICEIYSAHCVFMLHDRLCFVFDLTVPKQVVAGGCSGGVIS